MGIREQLNLEYTLGSLAYEMSRMNGLLKKVIQILENINEKVTIPEKEDNKNENTQTRR